MITKIEFAHGVFYQLVGTPVTSIDECGDVFGSGYTVERCTPGKEKGEVVALFTCYHGDKNDYGPSWENAVVTIHSLMDENISGTGLWDLSYAVFNVAIKTERYYGTKEVKEEKKMTSITLSNNETYILRGQEVEYTNDEGYQTGFGLFITRAESPERFGLLVAFLTVEHGKGEYYNKAGYSFIATSALFDRPMEQLYRDGSVEENFAFLAQYIEDHIQRR